MDCEYKNQRKFIRCFVYKKISFIRCLGKFDAEIIHFLRRKCRENAEKCRENRWKCRENRAKKFSTLLNMLIISASVEV